MEWGRGRVGMSWAWCSELSRDLICETFYAKKSYGFGRQYFFDSAVRV